MKRALSGTAFAALTALMSGFVSLTVQAAPYANKVWVVVRPVQCLGNPWEKEWLARNNNQGVKYPMKKESAVIQGYFGRLGIPVLEVRVRPYMSGDALCATCDCPRGDTLFLLIHGDDAIKMSRLGYAKRLPLEELKKKKKRK